MLSLVRRILGELPANLSANFDGEFFFGECLGLGFPGFQTSQKKHAQNSRPELSTFPPISLLESHSFSRRFSAYRGNQEFCLSGDKIQGPSWGTTKETETPFLAASGPTF